MKITFGNIAVNLFVTVFGGLLLILATNYLHLGTNEQPPHTRPQIDMLFTSVEVPKAVKGFYTPSDIGIKGYPDFNVEGKLANRPTQKPTSRLG